MPRTYDIAGQDVGDLLDVLVSRHYKELAEAFVTFDLLLAYGPRNKEGEITAPAIVLQGHRAAATVRVNSHKDRVKGLNDVTIEIDGDLWPEWSAEARAAVLDHELYHLELVPSPDGRWKLDNANRPRLRLKKHDFHFGGFRAIADRHRGQSFEVQAVEEAYSLIAGERGQLEWPWAAPQPNRKLARS